jgi:hypothetical protein
MAEEFTKLQTYLINDLNNRTAALKAQSLLTTDENISSINEVIFVRDFLPLFSGESLDNRNYLLEAWYIIAGNPYKPVNVVDSAGRFIIQIPPILDRNAISAKSNSGELSGMFEHALQRSVMSVSMAENMISEELDKRFNQAIEQDVNQDLAKQWELVMVHYKKTKTNAGGAKPADNFDCEFEY